MWPRSSWTTSGLRTHSAWSLCTPAPITWPDSRPAPSPGNGALVPAHGDTHWEGWPHGPFSCRAHSRQGTQGQLTHSNACPRPHRQRQDPGPAGLELARLPPLRTGRGQRTATPCGRCREWLQVQAAGHLRARLRSGTRCGGSDHSWEPVRWPGREECPSPAPALPSPGTGGWYETKLKGSNRPE